MSSRSTRQPSKLPGAPVKSKSKSQSKSKSTAKSEAKSIRVLLNQSEQDIRNFLNDQSNNRIAHEEMMKRNKKRMEDMQKAHKEWLKKINKLKRGK